jgi:hypothetical protein
MLVVAFVSKELKMAKAQAIFSQAVLWAPVVAVVAVAGFAASGDYLAASLLAVPTVALIMTSAYKNSR